MQAYFQAIQYLPDLVSVHGFIFYSLLAYIFSFTVSVCLAKFVQKNLDIEGGVKKNIVQNRQKKQKRQRLVNEIKKTLANNQVDDQTENSTNQQNRTSVENQRGVQKKQKEN